MKRILPSTGFALLMLPQMAGAANSQVCSALKGVKPVSSHYVQKVLDRTQAGLGSIRSASANPDFEKYLPSWARNIGGAINGMIDSYLTLTLEQKDLLDATACLHVDTLLLDCALMETQDELQAQLKKNSIWGIIQGEALLEFIKERKVHLLRGALNPNYQDPTWNLSWRFESESSAASSSGSESPLCPFDSDYAPPAADGYGCDTSLLYSLTAYPPARTEKEAWDALQQELDVYKGLARGFSALEQELNALHDRAVTPSARSGAQLQGRQGHKEISVCQEQTPPDSLRLRSVRSPFSYKKNDIGILSDFLAKRTAEGLFREQSDELKNPSEFDDPEERKEREESANPLIQLFTNTARRFFQTINGEQGSAESAFFATTPDGTLEAASALSDLRKSVGELSRLSGKKEGLRSFVIRFAYFLRRSCIYRPCNTSLERVLRTAYADECFPYTDGAFLTDTEKDSRWQKCAKAACIQVDGVSLPGNCKEVLP